MSGVDLFTAACGLGMLSTSALAIWATWSRGVALDRLRKANERAERWKAEREHAFFYYKQAHGAWLHLLNKENERKASRSAHMRAIGIKGNQSDKRRKREG